MKSPAPQIEIYFDGIDSSRYGLVEAEYTLDGKPLSAPNLKAPEQKGQLLFTGNVTPGNHSVTAKLVFLEGGNKVFTYVKGTRFKLPGHWTLTAQRGLLLRLRTHVEVDDGQSDPKKRLELKAEVEPKMLAAVDDGSLPPLPNAKRAVEDAGLKVATAPRVKKKSDPDTAAATDEGDDNPARAGKRRPSGTDGTALAQSGAPDAGDLAAAVPPDAGVSLASAEPPDAGGLAPVAVVTPAEGGSRGWLAWGLGAAVAFGLLAWFVLAKRRRS